MIPAAVLSYANLAIQVLPLLISAGQEVGTLLATLRQVLNGGGADPTTEQWDVLDKAMSGAMQALLASAKAAPIANAPA